jgi:hypothetical protein
MRSVARLIHAALLVFCTCGVAAPARAAVVGLRADFDADGVLDTALLRATSSAAQIEVRLSGRARPIFLLTTSPVHGLRSIDLTGDGRNDLLAVSSAGLLFWINLGGRFVPAPLGLVIASGRAPVAGTPPGPDEPVPLSIDNDSAPPVVVCVALPAPDLVVDVGAQAVSVVLPRAPCATPISRAPPVLA